MLEPCGGINSGMNFLPDYQSALEELGEKVIEIFARAVRDTREDLQAFRRSSPYLASIATGRTVANVIHDWLWDHLVRGLSGIDDIVIIDDGITREFIIHQKYRVRVKRHDGGGGVSTQPTPTALAFMEQGQLNLGGHESETVNLIAGYHWHSVTNEIAWPVLSLRDSLENVIWLIVLSEPSDGTPVVTPHLEPTAGGPTIAVVRPDRDSNTGTDAR